MGVYFYIPVRWGEFIMVGCGSDYMGIIFSTRVARGACCGCKFRQCIGRVSRMSAGILLYTRVAGRSSLWSVGCVSDCTGIKINTHVAGVRALGVNLSEALEECPQ